MSEEVKEALTASAIQPGDVVTGHVTGIEDKKVTVDIGYKFEGIVPIRELSALHISHPSDVVRVGDEIRAVVIKIDEDDEVVVLSKREADAQGAWDELLRRYEQNESFDVVVHDVVKGGLVTDLGVRGFIPASLVDRHFVDDLTTLKGQTLRVKIIEIDPENNKLILSRKAVLEDQRQAEIRERLASLQPGEVLEGTVRRLASFGVFVDIGGVDGLVHISELAWHHVNHPSEVVHEGDVVRVKVLGVDPDAGRVSLSMKGAEPDPWDRYIGEFHEGDIVEGVVRRVVDFGAFVELRPGLEGLVHVSQISYQRVPSPADVLQEGQSVKVKVLGIDPERKRIALSIKEATGSGERRREPRWERMVPSNQGTGATLGDLFGDLFKRTQG
jgi:small subunit ribosomal protein S1